MILQPKLRHLASDTTTSKVCHNCFQTADPDATVCSRCQLAQYCSCETSLLLQQGASAADNYTPRPPQEVYTQVVHEEGAKYCYLRTVGLQELGYPEILAVDVETDAVRDVADHIHCVYDYMLEQKNIGPNLWPCTLGRSRKHGGSEHDEKVFFTLVQVTNHKQLQCIISKYFVDNSATRSSTSSATKNSDGLVGDCILVLMPALSRRKNSFNNDVSWGRSPAPQGQIRLRNTVQDKIKLLHYRDCKYIRWVDGDRSNLQANNLSIVSFGQALANSKDWETSWRVDFTPEEVEYVEQNRAHFLDLSIHSSSRDRANKYLEEVCRGDRRELVNMYKSGIKIEDGM